MLQLLAVKLAVQTVPFVTIHKIIFWIVFVVSTGLFCFQSYIYVSKYLWYEVQMIITTKQNESLPLPVISLIHTSNRHENHSAVIPPVQLTLTSFSMNNTNIPAWATSSFVFFRNSIHQKMWLANVFNYSHLNSANLTLQDAKQKWPLKAEVAGSSESGKIALHAEFNATNFIEYPDANGNYDYIEVAVSNFEIDAPADETIKFQLLPCESIEIVVALEHFTMINRTEKPCRNDYPENLWKEFLKFQIDPQYLYNPIFAPDLPYSEYTCNAMCHVKYWLQKCGCYVFDEIWFYAGKPSNTIVCQSNGEKCTNREETIQKTPMTEIKKCECFPKCSGYRFRLGPYFKMHYGVGM